MKQILPESDFSARNMVGMFIKKTISDLSQAYMEKKFWKELIDIICFRLVQYLGTWQGYRFSGNIDQKLHRQFYYPPGSLTDKIPESRLIEPISYPGEEKN